MTASTISSTTSKLGATLPGKPQCYHCGDPCKTDTIKIEEKFFCCEGCQLVFEIINNNGLCDYYSYQRHPGLAKVKAIRKEKFAYLDEPKVAELLYSFTDGDLCIVKLYIPGVHCSSCMWLLEHLRQLREGILASRLNFGTKEVTIHFSSSKITIRQLVELLCSIGYEPQITLNQTEEKSRKKPRGLRVYRLGVAAFCFSFIMMMSFPEYFGGFGLSEKDARIFRSLNLLLGIPVFFFSAGEFFSTAWKGLKTRTLNIDAPIALAVTITFARSVYEILSGTGGGYLDSMSGIVFFMLIGRMLQERTYHSLSFHRDYKSYFPIAVTVQTSEGWIPRNLQELKTNDLIQLHNEEIIPADGILEAGNAQIDYSFVTGESAPVLRNCGDKIFAGGRQIGEQILVRLTQPVSGSYLSSLWNHQSFSKNKSKDREQRNSVQIMSRYFTAILFILVACVAVYWWMEQPANILPAATSMLIVACPCALLLAATFTNSNLIRLFSNAGLYLKDATVIEALAKTNSIVFDKTGTLTQGTEVSSYTGDALSSREAQSIHSLVAPSQHPYSRALAAFTKQATPIPIKYWQEYPGEGVRALIDDQIVKVGNARFVGITESSANVYAQLGEKTWSFTVTPRFRPGLKQLVDSLRHHFELTLLSGDTATQEAELRQIFGADSQLNFGQQPIDKLQFIENLQQSNRSVMMIGDGLNDAGALQQSDVGITLAEDINNFSPACDAILDARNFHKLPQLLQLAKASKWIIGFSFFISILYNIIGLSIAAAAAMNPMIAAILMPASTLSIVLLSTGLSTVYAWKLGLTKVS